MNLSRKWLGEFVDVDANDKEFAEIMTMAGSKVETYERLDSEIKNVVVGKVLSMTRTKTPTICGSARWTWQGRAGADCHRRAERPRGRPGARGTAQLLPPRRRAHHQGQAPGRCLQRHALLPQGAGTDPQRLPLRHRRRHLDPPGGLHRRPGHHEVIGNDDTVVEFEITNNRPDCFSLIGLAREAAAAFNQPLRHHEPVVKGGGNGSLTDLLDVEVPAEDLCSRYTARMVRNVKIAPLPQVDAPAAALGRRAPHQQHRRHHQLRDDRVRPAHARLRLPLCEGRQDHRPPRRGG